jgi:hypothetical protein
MQPRPRPRIAQVVQTIIVFLSGEPSTLLQLLTFVRGFRGCSVLVSYMCTSIPTGGYCLQFSEFSVEFPICLCLR